MLKLNINHFTLSITLLLQIQMIVRLLKLCKLIIFNSLTMCHEFMTEKSLKQNYY